MRLIQNNSLPQNWLQQINNFDISKSTLSQNNKIIAEALTDYIKNEGKESLLNPLVKSFVSHVVLKKDFLKGYENIPHQLVKDGMDETRGERGFNFTRKLHSVFIEFQIYMELESYGFQFTDQVRTEGACDLQMEKNNKNYNFEVKFKESKDIFKSRLLSIIDNMSLLNEYAFLRGKTFEIHVKSSNVSYKVEKEIFDEIKCFLKEKKDTYKGKYIDIFELSKQTEFTRDITKVNKYTDSLKVSQELTDQKNISNLIQKMFIENNGHITKLSNKSKNSKNFYGCLVWSIPFHNDIDCKQVKAAFDKLKLDFDLYVFISGIAKDDCNFLVAKKKCKNSPSPMPLL
ncbi:hypothetical protein [uncultured Cocleimonas sp.]|uniref:hypothetical protein n=1 Tax=uncultured Cocleimonas sp. TaxID=1051587 RepID=UPI00261D4379|nr:hypothetical protein [uncultured Cocleimonas sp.]